MNKLLLTLACITGLSAPASAVTIDWVTVGSPGNAADTEVMTCCGAGTGTTGYGSVADTYRISKTEVTNAQYAEFLNAVAATDTNGLYNVNMNASTLGGITQSGSPGSFSYATKAGMGSKPVNYVSFWDSLRFTNWLHNGQGAGSTETGAYTITPAGIAANSITRNAGATIFLTSEDEWYKAAYYDAVSTSYLDFTAGSNAMPGCVLPGADTGNSANCWPAASPSGALTDVGAYTLSGSPSGTFDQGGNVWEWNEAIVSGSIRGVRGGSFNSFDPNILAASIRSVSDPANESSSVGFRVASLPEPGTGLLLMVGTLGLAYLQRRDS